MSTSFFNNGLPAPAKLNLCLNILNRKPDGYHELQTVYRLIDLQDKVFMQPREDTLILYADNLGTSNIEDNTCIRAAEVLQQSTGCDLGVELYLEKHIPIGGGLGGGSSDAATVIYGLNLLWECGLNKEQLSDLCLKVGADVPFFIFGYSAWAEGIGERFSKIEVPDAWYLVIKPPFEISTEEIFNAPELTRNNAPITIGDVDAHFIGVNVFEPVVRKRYPKLNETMDWLSEHAVPHLTGTGSCFFAAFNDRVEAEEVLERLPADCKGYIVKGLHQSPLLENE